ncbi:isopropanol dehydrogenase [Colletotrichum incanum]|uniref:Isopropanol dehydrogenase n=1 Tax=Colletotrichum incanum TaxID=1573173 RepID=A0A167AZT1_COLIC|nr:isopropanol dehydrogenase [Colletotrichum incanum]
MGNLNDGGLGYSLEDLTHLLSMLVPFGGLADIDVKAWDTIIIAPATGRYGSAAVHLALAMGARVIAIGRNVAVLAQLGSISQRLTTVRNTGDAEEDTKSLRSVAPAGVDAFWDMSPPGAGSSSHFRSALDVLKHGARVSLMGSVSSGVSFDYMQVMVGGLTVKGTWMCTSAQTKRLIDMAESGVLSLGQKTGSWSIRAFRLEDWKEALDTAAERIESGEVIITPQEFARFEE